MAGHTLLGYVLAVGWTGLWSGQELGAALLALFIWVVCLNGGTLAINSVYDQDEGDIGYLNSPPPLPKHLQGFSWVLLGAGQVLAFALPWGFPGLPMPSASRCPWPIPCRRSASRR